MSEELRALRSHPSTASLAALLGAAAIVACGRGADAGARFTVRDSAGINIVESSAPTWEEGQGWRVANTVLLDVGTREGDEASLLDEVMGVLRMEDGGIVVANMGDHSVRRYDGSGRHLWSAGRAGGGPGEFQQLWRIQRHADGILAAQSREMWPSHVFSLDGRLVRSIVKEAVPGGRPIGFDHVFADGSYLMYEWPQGYPVKGEEWTDSATIFRLSADGSSLDSLVRLPAVRFVRTDTRRGDYVRFGPRLQVAAGEDAIFASYPDDYEIEVYDLAGNLTRRIRRAWPPEAVSASAIEEYRQYYIDLPAEGGGEVPQRLRAQREQMMADAPFASHYAAHGPMIVDRAGNLWVQHDIERVGGTHGFNPVYAEPTPWDVFDARGVWLGRVETPPRFAVLEIGADYIAGVWRDALDVEHVRVYALEK